MPLAPGQTLSFYEIVAPLGAGGMGEVYRARDTRLGRDVALKVLPEALRADPERRARFLREARAVAKLNHPHIAQIHDVGEADGHDYIVFELVEGETLSDALARRRLELPELLDLALPLADALTYAHESGIVHRDLKPGNVMVTARGHAKLLDFGLAKVLQEGAAQRSGKPTTLTIEGAIFGTPAAMSPEQALGKDLDARSDVFSFGSLLYEMASGRPAFDGGTVMEVMDAVIHRDPPALARVRPELPDGFGAIVEKALRKDPRERYQTVSDLAADLRHFKRTSESGLVPPARASRRRLRLAGAASVALAALAALAWWLLLRGGGAGPGPAPDAGGNVAVLYFENRIDPSDADQLADMLTHLLTTELAREPELAVLSQQRLFETARRTGREDGTVDTANASAVASAAGVSSMVIGRVARAGDQLLATASVVDTRSGRELGAGQARGTGAEDVFAMAEELGGALRAALRPAVPPAGAADGRPPGDGLAAPATSAQPVTTSVEAYRAFLSGFEAMQRLEFEQACAHFATATTLDPTFAQAWYWDAIASGWMEDVERQLRSIERAKAFRERLPAEELRLLPAAELYHAGRFIECLPLLEALVREDPGSRDAWYMLGEVYLHSPANADARRAARAFERVLEIDPLFSLVGSHVAYAWLLAGERDEAIAWHERLLAAGDDDGGVRESALAMWSEDLDWTARVARERAQRSAAGREVDDWMNRFARLLLLQAALARGDRADPAFAWARGVLSQPSAGVAEAPSVEKAQQIASLHQMLVLEGDLARASAIAELLPPAASVAGTNDYAAGEIADIHLLSAYRLDAVGEGERALAMVADVCASVDAPRALWQAVALNLRHGHADAARRHLASLESLASRTARSGYYLELARAELDLAEGRADRALPVFERALAADRVNVDLFASVMPQHGRILRGILDANRALGDTAALRATLARIVDRRFLRAWDPVLWRLAQAELGALELESGDAARGRALLEDFLAAWGESGRGLPAVERARLALAATQGR